MPKHVVEFPLENISFEDYLALAIKAAEDLKWTVTVVSESGLRAESPMSLVKNTWGEEITLVYSNGFVELKSKSKGNTLFDFGKNKKNIAALIGKIDELKITMDPQEAMQLKETIAENQVKGENDLLNPVFPATREEKQWWKIFIPSGDLFITPILIDINILLFVLMVISSGSFGTLFLPDTDILLKWGGNFKPSTLEGEWWRLFTCMFEHIGIIHLAMNMYAFLYIGIFLEPILGRWRFLTAYIVTGIAASMVSLWWHDNTVSAGASGAIFGMYGVFLSLLLTNIIDPQIRKALLPSIGIFIGYNLLSGLKSGVDNAAHIGGLVSGLLISLLLYFSLKQRQNKILEKITIGSLLTITIISVMIIIPLMNNPVGEYIKIMNRYQEFETVGLKVYELPDSTGNEILLAEFNNNTIPNLERCNEEIQKVHQLKLPDELKKRADLLDEYTTVRLKEANLRKKALMENTDTYNKEIGEEVDKIKSLLAEINK